MTRRRQLWVLIFLSAATVMLQYVIQGASATGGNPSGFSQWFWIADWGLWALRALVEAWIVVYVFTTTAKTTGQKIVLGLLEIGLLALITFTLGPALQALGMGKTVYEIIGEGYGVWSYAIGAYTSLMMAAAGFAYQIQPQEIAPVEQPSTVPQKTKLTRAQGISLLMDIIREKGTINQSAFARQANVHPQTVGRWLRHMEEHQIIVAAGGNGNFAVIEEEMEMPFA